LVLNRNDISAQKVADYEKEIQEERQTCEVLRRTLEKMGVDPLGPRVLAEQDEEREKRQAALQEFDARLAHLTGILQDRQVTLTGQLEAMEEIRDHFCQGEEEEGGEEL
jgi:hypothetical protein